MKKHRLLLTTLFLFVFTGMIFGQAQRSANINDGKIIKEQKVQKEKKELKKNESRDISPFAQSQSSHSAATTKAVWDILYTFNSAAAGQQAVATDGNFIYLTDWQGGGTFHKYTMTGTFVEDFTIATAANIRDFAYDGTYFYGAAGNMSLFKLDLTNEVLVSTITATCSGVTGIRHCAYDPTLDGGNGGFWIGQWTELGAVSKTGSQIVANVAGTNLNDCYGSAYDKWTDPSNPRLLLFCQINSMVEIHAFDINTQTFSGLVHDATDIAGYLSATTLAGGLESYEDGGKLILLGDLQEDPNIIFAYELANTAPVAAPGAPTAFVATPGASGAMTVSATWTNPAVTVGGAVLTELTSVSLYIDAVVTPLYTNSSPVIGGNESQTAIDLSAYTPGFHTFKVVGTNTAGEGLPTSVTEWIGEDVPEAPDPATLIEGTLLQAQVSWIAPTTGLNGQFFSGTGVTYDVIRYPGGTLVSDDQTAVTFQETLTTAGYYYYTIEASNNSGVGGMATTDSLWLGEDVPAAPGSVTLTNPSGMDANLTWTAPTAGLHGGYFTGSNLTYDVVRMPGNVLVSDDQTGLTFTETIVSPGNYYYTVTASNAAGVGGSANSNVVLFGDFLIFEDFEGLFPNTGWSTVSNTAVWAQATGTVHPSGNAAHSPDKLAYFNSFSVTTGTASLITPTIDMAGATGEFSFWMFHDPDYTTNYDNIQLKMSTDGGTTWTNVGTPLQRYSATLGWVKHSYVITGGTGTTSFDFFATSAYGNDIHIDDVTLVELTGCIQPSNLTAIPSDVSADLDWTENSTAVAWEIEWGAPSFTQGTGSIVAVTGKPYTLSGLTPYTSYDYYVRADCGGSSYSPWIGPFTFTTSGCPLANQCSYTYTTEDEYSDGWNGASIIVTEDGHVIATIDGSIASGSIALCFGSTVTLTWVEGLYDSECGFTFHDPSGINVYSFIIGNAPVAGVFSTFTACPTCPAPSALNATGITTTSATLGWTPSGSETLWNIEWGAAGYTFGTGTAVTGITSPAHPLSGLTIATPYDFYVQADCGSGDISSWAGPFTFNTQCSTISTYPWFDDLETGIGCYNVSGISATTWYWDNVTGSPYSGTYNVTCEYDPAPANQDQWFKSRIFDLTSLSDPQITFFWNMSYAWAVDPNDNYDVFLKGTTDGITWTDIWTEPTNSFTNWTWYDTTMSLAAFSGSATFQFAFNYVGYDGAAFYLDDITIDNITSDNQVVYKPLIIYPNPTTGMVYVNETAESIIVTDVLGQVLVDKKYVQNVDLSGFKQGIYIIKVTNNNQTYLNKITLVK